LRKRAHLCRQTPRKPGEKGQTLARAGERKAWTVSGPSHDRGDLGDVGLKRIKSREPNVCPWRELCRAGSEICNANPWAPRGLGPWAFKSAGALFFSPPISKGLGRSCDQAPKASGLQPTAARLLQCFSSPCLEPGRRNGGTVSSPTGHGPKAPMLGPRVIVSRIA